MPRPPKNAGGTFANRFNRFNRFHGARGHLFQGRDQSILTEGGRPLLGLVDFIHLNPVRAGLLALPNLGEHTFSSYPKFFRKLTCRYCIGWAVAPAE